METVPGRQKEENLSNQSTVNKVHFMYPRAENLKKITIKRLPTPPTRQKNHPKCFSSELNISLGC